MNTQPIIIWMNCYGAWDPNHRHPVETIGYNQYLDAFVQSIVTLQDRIKCIYISGGMIDESGQTECATVKPELQRRFAAQNNNLEIKIDEESITSMSIARKFVQTCANEYSDHLPLLFVDEIRFESNLYTVEYFYKKFGLSMPPIRQIVIPLPRLDAHPNSTREFQKKKLDFMKEKGVEVAEQAEIETRQANSKKL